MVDVVEVSRDASAELDDLVHGCGAAVARDWLGYTVFGLFLAAGLIHLWDMMGPWDIAPAIAGVGAGLVWTIRDQRVLDARGRGSDDEILGFFLVSRRRVPAGVRNWFS